MHANLGFLGAAYLIVWAGITLYLLSIARRQRALERRLEELAREREGKKSGSQPEGS